MAERLSPQLLLSASTSHSTDLSQMKEWSSRKMTESGLVLST